MKPKINYVIAAWSGPRRGKPRPTRQYEKYFKDRTYYLRFHLDWATKLKKYISHITIVAPFNFEEEPKAFGRYLEEVSEGVGGIEVTVIRRTNIGVSFGSFSHAFRELGTDWEYYIFNEDDHIPVCQDFDAVLLGGLKKSKSGSVCAWLRTDDKYAENPVIGHPLSIAKSTTLARVAKVNEGKLPYKLDPYSGLSADEFSYGFYKAGYKITDMTETHCGSFAKGNGRIWWFGGVQKSPTKIPGKEALVVPIEVWENSNKKHAREITNQLI